MITFHTSTNVTADRQVILTLPPETPIGKAELVVTVNSQQDRALPPGSLRRRFGTIRSNDSRSAGNERIDADLARSYGNSHE
jgi:hypothetical protein